MATERNYILGVDIGTTNVRCMIFDRNCEAVARYEQKLETHNPTPGHFEIDPDYLFDLFVQVVKGALEVAKIRASEVISMGISVQRNTFTCWNRTTGKVYFPFSSWMDTRAAKLVSDWNHGYIMRTINLNARLIYAITRSPKFAVASILSFKSATCPVRLQFHMESDAQLKADVKSSAALFGCIETYLVWRLSGSQKVHVTEPSCASATQFFDPFTLTWSPLTCRLFGVPMNIFPRLVPSTSEFCETAAELFGAPISVRALSADQQAGAFGECCFSRGDVKCTLGTAAFIDINTGDQPHGSMESIYPLAAWKLREKDDSEAKVTFLAEGHVRAAGLVLEWLRNVGLLQDFGSLDSVINQVPVGSHGVCFVGTRDSTHETRHERTKSSRSTRTTRSDSNASTKEHEVPVAESESELDVLAGAIVGVRLATSREDMVRAACESIVFGVVKILRLMAAETKAQVRRIRLSGGLSRSRAIMQLLADLSGCAVERAKYADDASCFGAAALAGVASSVWTVEQLRSKRSLDVECLPDAHNGALLQAAFDRWLSASQMIP